jgi:histidinol-phosphatase (PHP family)
MKLSNYHIHTHFCDGSNEPVKYIEEAILKKITSIGFSAHAPMPFYCKWTLPENKLSEYFAEIQTLKSKYSQHIEIYCGLELDYIPEFWDNYTQKILRSHKWDFIIGSIHFVDKFPDDTHWTIDGGNDEFKKGLSVIFNNNSETVIRHYFEYTRQMVRLMKPQIIGHIDKIKMQHRPDCLIPDSHTIFREEMLKTFDEIACSECIIEINTRGIYRRNEPEYYPGKWAISEMAKRHIPVTINSDAHKPEEIVMLWNETARLLYNSGYRTVKLLQKGMWVDQEIGL